VKLSPIRSITKVLVVSVVVVVLKNCTPVSLLAIWYIVVPLLSLLILMPMNLVFADTVGSSATLNMKWVSVPWVSMICHVMLVLVFASILFVEVCPQNPFALPLPLPVISWCIWLGTEPLMSRMQFCPLRVLFVGTQLMFVVLVSNVSFANCVVRVMFCIVAFGRVMLANTVSRPSGSVAFTVMNAKLFSSTISSRGDRMRIFWCCSYCECLCFSVV